MHSHSEICKAIKEKKLIQFHYKGSKQPGIRIVEPHMVAHNNQNTLCLNAWYLRGASESRQGPGWREYHLAEISTVTILQASFSGPRRGYKPDGGEQFHNSLCKL